MSYSLLLPAAIALGCVVLGFAGTTNRLPPHVRASLLSVLTVLAAASIVVALASVVAASLLTSSSWGVVARWCSHGVTSHVAAPAGVGVVAGGLLLVGVSRAVMLIARERRAVRSWEPSGSVAVVDVPEVVAFSMPHSETIVVSSGALAELDDTERRAVLAHERAHLEFGHHRHLWATELSVAFVPALAPLAAMTRTAVERAADEAAAVRIGDRRAVARALARLALQAHQAGAATQPHLRVGGIEHRVRRLLGSPPGPLTRPAVAMAIVLMGAAVAAGGVQAHHLGEVLAHVCWGA